jgi:UDP-2,3-diacylglucosamine hydrolase
MIGLIFGENKLPFEILKKVKKKKIKYLIIDLTKKKIFKKSNFSPPVSIGQFGKIIKILKLNKCKKVLFAGKVEKPNFSKLRLDFKGIYYISRIIKNSKIGDAAILKEIIKILKQEKINTIDSLSFNKELALKKGIYSITRPNNQDKIDIKKAIHVLKKQNKYNFSQAAVIRNKKIIAVEGRSGTDKMLKKCRDKKFKSSGVLVKFPKEKQDLRVDLPTVGLKTFYQCKSAGLKGIVLRSKKNVFLEKKKCIKFANKNKMFITSI